MPIFCNKCKKINNDSHKVCSLCQNPLAGESGFSVLIIDMSHYMDEENEYIVRAFPTIEVALDFARNKVRASLEELREPGQSKEELRQLWYLYGEDAIVPEANYSGSSELDLFTG